MRRIRYEFNSTLNQRLIDAIIIGGSFYAAYQIRFGFDVHPEMAFQMWLLLPFIMAGRVLTSSLLRMYRMVWRFIGLVDAAKLARNYLIFSVLLLFLRYDTPHSFALVQVPLGVIIIECLLSIFGCLGIRAFRRLLWEGLATKALGDHSGLETLLIGAGRAGGMVAREIVYRTDLSVVGFLDDDPLKIGKTIFGLPVLGCLDSLPSVVAQHQIKQLVICIPKPPRDVLKRIWAVSEEMGVHAKIVPTLRELLEDKSNIAAFRDVQMSDLLRRDPISLSSSAAEVGEAFRGKHILITGAGGSIGSELAFQLTGLKPAQVVLLDKDENGLNDAYLRIESARNGTQIFPVVADIRFPDRIRSILANFRPQVIFHAAAHKHVHLMEANPSEAVLNNVVGTANLLEQVAVVGGVHRFVFVSTDKAVNPTSIMGATKRVCEMLVQRQPVSENSHYCCVRFGNVLGSRGSVVPIFKKQIAQGGPITITHPDAERFLMTIPEAVCLLIQAGALSKSGEIFVLDMGKPIRVTDLARDLIELSGLRPHRDIAIEITQLRRGEKLSECLFDDATEKLLPTKFEKIRVINQEEIVWNGFVGKLQNLVDAAYRDSAKDIYAILRDMNLGFGSDRIQNQSEQASDASALRIASN
jgi:FlaA1/EpsC-like NDP-sugar epimerase